MAKTSKLKMTRLQLVTEFHPAIISLGSLKVKDLTALMRISKARRVAEEAMKEHIALRKNIAEQECEKDDKGRPVVEDGRYLYTDVEAQKQTIELLDELEAKEVELEIEPIDIKLLDGVEGLTGNTIMALGDFITE